MTDTDIKKGLANMTYGSHYCAKCKYDNGKGDDRCGLKGCKISRYALDYINRLETENERLNKAIATLSANAVGFAEEIDRHIKDKNNVFELAVNIVEAEKIIIAEAKAEAYKEFAERLKEKGYFPRLSITEVVSIKDIDNLLKEMVGEDK